MPSGGGRFIRFALVTTCFVLVSSGPVTGQAGYDVYTYVTEYWKHSVVIFKNLQMLDTIVTSGGASTNSVGITPDLARLYVTNNNGDSVSVLVVEPQSREYCKEIAVIQTGARPISVKVHLDGHKVYVATGKSVVVIDSDPASSTYNTVVKTISVPGYAFDLDFSPEGDRLFVVHHFEGWLGNLSVIDTLEDSLVDTDGDPTNGITPMVVGQHADRRDFYKCLRIGPNGYGYILNTEKSGPGSGRGNTVSVFDSATMLPYDIDNDPTTTSPGETDGTSAIELPGFLPVALYFNPEGTRLYVTQKDTTEDATDVKGKILMIDTDPTSPRFNQILKVQEAGIRPEGVGVWPDGRYVWVSCRYGRMIRVFDASLRPVTTLPMNYCGEMVSVKRPKAKRASVESPK